MNADGSMDRQEMQHAMVNWLTAVQQANGLSDEDLLAALRWTIELVGKQGLPRRVSLMKLN